MSETGSQDRLRQALKEAKALHGRGDADRALATLRGAFGPDADFSLQIRAAKWVASVEWPRLKTLRVAFLGAGVLDQLIDLTAFWLALFGYRLESYCSLYDAWRMDVLNSDGPLYRFAPEIVWFFGTRRDMRQSAAAEAVDGQKALWQAIREGAGSPVVIQNIVDAAPERVYGNLDALVADGFQYFIEEFNAGLVREVPARGVLLFDLRHLAACCGLWRWSDPAYWHHSKHPFSPSLSGFVAYHMARQIVAIRGGSKKVAVLDLDNTLWGGVIGDDGVEGIVLGNGPDGQAYQAFQAYLKALSARGIVLAVASKNDEAIAKAAFAEHPDMVLALDDIAVFKANWRNKADNIREIAEALDLGLDSFVFVDDNPAERDLVRRELPMVDVVELPPDPSGYIQALDSCAFFETIAVSDEDRARAGMYRANAARNVTRSQSTDLGEYLRGLDMVGEAGSADSRRLSRMAQLVNKSNQFHLTTTRYGEAEMAAFAADSSRVLRWYSLADRFGDYGLIAVVLLRLEEGTATIDTWAMSCRVLERGMEEFILRDILEIAGSRGCARVRGIYISSRKNGLVAGLYERLGFSALGADDDGVAGWELPVAADRTGIPLHIRKKDEE